MKALGIAIALSAVAAAGFITACFSQPEDDEEDFGSGEAHIETVDPLEGAYEKIGGTPLHFVFKKGDTDKNNTFFGQIDVSGTAERANGKIAVGRDNLGTTFTLSLEGSKARDAGAPDASDGGAPVDNRSLVQQAFSGTMHFLKIGKNETILVRGDTNGKTAHYKKVKSWCAAAEDCASEVQKTGLECADTAVTCTSKSVCSCE